MRVKPHRLSVNSRLLLGLLLLLLAGFGIRQAYTGWNDPPYSGARWRREQQERVFEAVFRYQIAENRHSDQICFLSVRKSAPDPALMQRFSAFPYVLPLSPRFQAAAGNYTDGATGHLALHFWIDQIDWDSDTEVRVAGGGGAANKSGNAGEFAVLWRRGEWQVLRYEPRVNY